MSLETCQTRPLRKLSSRIPSMLLSSWLINEQRIMFRNLIRVLLSGKRGIVSHEWHDVAWCRMMWHDVVG